MKVAVIGLWHQGVVGAACLASLGHDVLAVDHNPARIAELTNGKAPVYEPGLDDLIQLGLKSGRLQFATDVARAVIGRPYTLIMFDTPVNENDESDLSEIFTTAKEIAPTLDHDATVLVTAQIPVGTCDVISQTIRAANPKACFGLAYSPENLRLGQAIERFQNPALPVIGADNATTLDRVEKLLATPAIKWQRVSLRTAEMTKHALNGFLAISVCFANELGNLCDEVGADGHRLAEVLRLEPRIGTKAMLFPGLGFSGGTLARDVQTLRQLGDSHGIDTPLLDGAWQSNQNQNRTVVRRLRRLLGGSLQGRRIAILGLTYKPDTSTLRRSAALEVIADLMREGAVVAASDPRANREELKNYSAFEFFDNPYAAVQNADAVVLMTPWKDYRDLDFDRLKATMARPLLFDTANLWQAGPLLGKGFTYLDIGRGRKAGVPA